jgi:hypothetical protein
MDDDIRFGAIAHWQRNEAQRGKKSGAKEPTHANPRKHSPLSPAHNFAAPAEACTAGACRHQFAEGF